VHGSQVVASGLGRSPARGQRRFRRCRSAATA